MMQIYHDGPIETYEVRDKNNGEAVSFSDFEAADLRFNEWTETRHGHHIEFVAVIAS